MRDEFDRILRFWFDRGVAGFRIDVAHMVVKDRELRDNPPATDSRPVPRPGDAASARCTTSNRPEVHDVHRRWRRVAEEYDPPRLLVGETFVARRRDDGRRTTAPATSCSSASTSRSCSARSSSTALREVVEETERSIPDGCLAGVDRRQPRRVPLPDAMGRRRSRDGRACALLMVLDAAGHRVPLLRRRARDDRHRRSRDDRRPRSGRQSRSPGSAAIRQRTPMPWSPEPGAGFTEAGVEPWLPFGDVAACNVADQRRDPSVDAARSPAT